MKVSIISHTQNAKELLLFSKRTRIHMCEDAYSKVVNMSEEEKEKELKYVFGTIKSSLEFIDYVFLIEDVTRAFTHQLVRHRVGTSFAQQSQRAVDVSDFECLATGGADCEKYHTTVENIRDSYKTLIKDGVKPQDARGILPTNTLTNILMKINLRALSGLLETRLCKKAQGEFQDVAKEMRKAVISIHPWADPVLCVYCVANEGRCAFPNASDCPLRIEGLVYEDPVLKKMIKDRWEDINCELKPKQGL